MAAWECPNCRAIKPRRADGSRVKRTLNHEASDKCVVCLEPKPESLGPIVQMTASPRPRSPLKVKRERQTLTAADIGDVQEALSQKEQ